MTTDEQVREVLKEHGLRGTAQRLAILRLLADAASGSDHPHGHLAVAEIHTRLARSGTQLDVTTIYRTLTTLVDLGVVHTVTDTTNALAYGLATGAHHHAVCRHCGTVVGIPAAELADAFAAVERVTGFASADVTLTVHGRCVDCR